MLRRALKHIIVFTCNALMLIKYQALISHLQKKIPAIYVLVGSDHYLLNDAAYTIKTAWRQRGETDERVVHLNTPADWNMLQEEANSYSLFYDQVLLDARLDKKTIDVAGKTVLTNYLQHINPNCLIILHASNVPPKQLQWLSNNQNATLVQATPFTGQAFQSWIVNQLQQHSISYDVQVPALIHQYTQNNLLACAQVLEKLALIYDGVNALSIENVKAQLVDQCEYQLYELADACLSANAEKAIHLLQQACNNRTEPTLILWLLTQEIRHLIQLSHAIKQHIGFDNACSQQKIWPQKARLYEAALKRLPLVRLYELLQNSAQLDEMIKTNQGQQIWNCLEQLSLSIAIA